MRSISACDVKIAVIERFYYYKIIMIKQHSQFNKPKYNELLPKRVNTPSGISLFLIVSSLLFFGGLMVFSASITLGQNFDIPTFEFDKDEKKLTLHISSGLENNLGEVIIPQIFLGGNLTFYLNGQEYIPDVRINEKISFVTLNFTGIGDNTLDILLD